MVNKLQEIRDKKDRAEEEYSEALRNTVKELREGNPMWTLQTIADVMGLTRQRIHQLLNSQNAPIVAVKELAVVNLTCGLCGVTFERAERIHLYRQSRGIKGAYCSSTCQRQGLGQLQRQRGRAARTECTKGHLMTQRNTLLITTKGPSGKPYQRRRCRTCRNTYARGYYHHKRQVAREAREEVKTDGNRV